MQKTKMPPPQYGRIVRCFLVKQGVGGGGIFLQNFIFAEMWANLWSE